VPLGLFSAEAVVRVSTTCATCPAGLNTAATGAFPCRGTTRGPTRAPAKCPVQSRADSRAEHAEPAARPVAQPSTKRLKSTADPAAAVSPAGPPALRARHLCCVRLLLGGYWRGVLGDVHAILRGHRDINSVCGLHLRPLRGIRRRRGAVNAVRRGPVRGRPVLAGAYARRARMARPACWSRPLRMIAVRGGHGQRVGLALTTCARCCPGKYTGATGLTACVA
jgi:hypothetical protein